MSIQQITLPVIGMTCANCVATVERSAKKAVGVTDAVVNFASEKVTLTYDPEMANLQDITGDVVGRVKRAGYQIPTASLELPLIGMTCANCANTIERSLHKVEGVIEANVNFASERASVTFAPGVADRAALVAAVRQAGYDVIETASDEELEDAEALAREAEIRHQWQRLVVAGTTTPVPTKRCVTVAPIWMCSSPWARPWLTYTVPLCCLR
jgi:Cu+-exporting ATPase